MKSLRSDEHILLVKELKKIRLEAGITQVELAQKLGVQQSYIAKVEGMERRLDVIEFVKWMSGLGQFSQAKSILQKISEVGG